MNRNRKTFGLLILMLLLPGLIILAGCGSSSPTSPGDNASGVVIGNSGCKSDSSSTQSGAEMEPECAEWTYNGGGMLEMTHINSIHNCCPGDIAAEITVDGSFITIQEWATAPECNCVCLYDIDFVFDGLEPEEYTFVFTTGRPPAAGHVTLQFTANLKTEPTGIYCE